ncbi:MAG TPA: rod shape-determining protein MreD [Gammaproteobacteria bacterium]
MRLAPGLTLFLALLLTALPLPPSAAAFKPDWIPVTLIYWSLASPPAFGLLAAFVIGLGLDALTGALLGQHALALVTVVYLVRRFRLRLRAFPLSQCTIAVAVVLALYEFVLFWADGVAGRTVPIGERWQPVLSGTLLWLLVWSAFDHGREHAPARL